MRILSFDVGIINLAYCIIEEYKILEWGIITLNNTKDHVKLYIELITNLDAHKHKFLCNIDTVLIEKQPSFNPKMRIIAGCLQTYFFIRGVVDLNENKIKLIKFFSPKDKLKCYNSLEPLEIQAGGNKYSRTKKLGIVICQKKLEEYYEYNNSFIEFFNKHKKKDDLADCYLQALTYYLQINKLLNKNSFIKINTVKKVTKKSIKEEMNELLSNKDKLIENINNNETFSQNLIKLFNISIPINKDSLGILLKKLQLQKKYNSI